MACNYITWRWNAPVTDTRPFPIKGIHVFTVNARGKLTETNFEFDVIAGAIDDGFTVLDQQGNEVVLTVA